MPQDLLTLGFIPPGKQLAMEDEGVVRILGDVFPSPATHFMLAGLKAGETVHQVGKPPKTALRFERKKRKHSEII